MEKSEAYAAWKAWALGEFADERSAEKAAAAAMAAIEDGGDGAAAMTAGRAAGSRKGTACEPPAATAPGTAHQPLLPALESKADGGEKKGVSTYVFPQPLGSNPLPLKYLPPISPREKQGGPGAPYVIPEPLGTAPLTQGYFPPKEPPAPPPGGKSVPAWKLAAAGTGALVLMSAWAAFALSPSRGSQKAAGGSPQATRAPKGNEAPLPQCPTEACLKTSFAQCQPAEYAADSGGVVTRYKVNGPRGAGCEMTLSYDKHPNAAWVNQGLTCDWDNTKPFKAAVEERIQAAQAGQPSPCSGPLLPLLKGSK